MDEIWTVRFGENLVYGVLQGKALLSVKNNANNLHTSWTVVALCLNIHTTVPSLHTHPLGLGHDGNHSPYYRIRVRTRTLLSHFALPFTCKL